MKRNVKVKGAEHILDRIENGHRRLDEFGTDAVAPDDNDVVGAPNRGIRHGVKYSKG